MKFTNFFLSCCQNGFYRGLHTFKISYRKGVNLCCNSHLVSRSMARKSPTLTVPSLNLLSPEDKLLDFVPNNAFSSSNKGRPLTPPLYSPSTTPPPTSPPSSPSGHFGSAIKVLKQCADKRDIQTSSMSIDEDVKDLCCLYPELNSQEKSEFLIYLAKNLAIRHSTITELIGQMPMAEKEKYSNNTSGDVEALVRWEDRLRQSLQPPYHWLATQISRVGGGVKFLVDLREDLLITLSDNTLAREDQVAFKALDVTLRELLSLWFTVGLLELQRITWESSCLILQKVSEYEAVHPVRSWTDLKRRVGDYRRCFIYTHACMPKEPLVVLHTFLTNEISDSMNTIVQNQPIGVAGMDGENRATITTAIFYSITSTQKGLKGIELGNYLIKRVVKELQAEFPTMDQFSSLSPIPGFVKWLESQLVKARRGEIRLFLSSEIEVLKAEMQVVTAPDAFAELQRLLKTNGWAQGDSLFKLLEEPFMRLCAYYLYLEKRRGFAFDSVANFHLRNGAVMWRLNWNADKSPRGLHNSCGIMVNYRYFLEDCESSSRQYLETAQIQASNSVTELAQSAYTIMNPI